MNDPRDIVPTVSSGYTQDEFIIVVRMPGPYPKAMFKVGMSLTECGDNERLSQALIELAEKVKS